MDKLKKEMERIPVPKNLHEHVKKGVAQVKYQHPKKRLWLFSSVAAVLLASAVTVGATNGTTLDKLRSLINPKEMEQIQLVEQIVEDEQLRVEVIAAMQNNEMSVIYLALQGLNNVQLTDSIYVWDYGVSSGETSSFEKISFDKQDNTVYGRITTVNDDGEFRGTELKLAIDSVTPQIEPEQITIPIDLSTVQTQQTEVLPKESWISGYLPSEDDDFLLKVLPYGAMNLAMPKVPEITIENIAQHEGKLYIQTKLPSEWPSVQFELVHKLTRERLFQGDYFPLYNNYIRDEQGDYQSFEVYIAQEKRDKYQESELLIDGIQLENYELQAVVSRGTTIYGDWKLKFPVAPIEMKEIAQQFTLDGYTVKRVMLSSFGIELRAEQYPENMEGFLTKKDGSIIPIQMASDETVKFGLGTAKLLADRPFDIEDIQSVMINGVEIKF